MPRLRLIVGFVVVACSIPAVAQPQGRSLLSRLADLEAAVAESTDRIAALEATVAAQASTIAALEGDIEVLSAGNALDGFLTVTTDDEELPLAVLEGINLQIISGAGGMTDENYLDPPTNGLGNLILGYNEVIFPEDRSGSHNLVIGPGHAYSSYGGLVAGHMNRVTGPYATVSGGHDNEASGPVSSISGGEGNVASTDLASVSGGFFNAATGYYSSVCGGQGNHASGGASVVSGGSGNTASAWHSTVGGGRLREANSEYDWVAGTLFEDE